MRTFVSNNRWKTRNLKMCRIYLKMDFWFSRDSITRQRLSGKISISSLETSEHTTRPHLPNDVPFKYLGVYTTPIGDQQCQLSVTVQIAKRGARIISANTFVNFQARLYNNTYLNNELYYPLPSISFSSKQYDLIHKAYIPQAISSMGYNRTWPLALRYGIHDYGGLKLKHCEVEALIRKIKAIQNLIVKTNSSKLITLIINWYQHTSGTTYSILENSPHSTTYVNSV